MLCNVRCIGSCPVNVRVGYSEVHEEFSSNKMSLPGGFLKILCAIDAIAFDSLFFHQRQVFSFFIKTLSFFRRTKGLFINRSNFLNSTLRILKAI